MYRERRNFYVKNKFYYILFFTLIIIFISCLGQKKSGEKNIIELRYGFTSEPFTFDPFNTANTADGRSILFNVFEGLVKPDTDGSLLPCIASSWSIINDAEIYNFEIREGVYFHDGSLLALDDIKFSLETAITAGIQGMNNISQIITSGDYNISVVLKTPDPDFLPFLTSAVVKAEITDREKDIIGTGPFYIESYSLQKDLVLRKFENYWRSSDDIPYFDKVTIVFLADSNAAILALRSRSIDGASITGSFAAQLPADQFELFHSYSASVQMMAINNAFPPFDDINIRSAINHGIDIQGIIDSAFFGMGEPSTSPVIPGLKNYYEKNSSYVYDPALAQKLLEEAGYGSGAKKLSLEITVPSNYTMHVDTAQVIAAQLQRIGIDTVIKLVDWASWLSEVYRNKKYQATIISVDAPNVSPRGFLSRYCSDAGGNFINFNNANYDRVFDAALTEINDKKRNELYREAQRIITGNAASVFIQDIFYFKAFRRGAYSRVLNYPLYVIDFASIRATEK
jgi:peptide/nickel transport system substrate-binding protein